jgi:endonuclease/exonuclease/phosphatase family metal-dependent hydrolase
VTDLARALGRFLFGLITLILFVLFVAGYLARYVHPSFYWWGELIAIGLPYVSLALLLSTVAALTLRRWFLLAVQLVLLGLALVRFVPAERLAGLPEPDGRELSLLTFNIPYASGPDETVKARGLIDLVRSHRADLVALQEAHVEYHPRRPHVRTRPYVRVLLDSLELQSPGPPLQGSIYTPQPVFSRIPIAEQTRTRVRSHPGDTDGTDVMRTVFEWEGRRAVLYNVHLRTFGERKFWREDVRPLDPRFWIPFLRQYRRAFMARAAEAEQIREMIAAETLPVILCGDLNSTAHNYAYHRVASSLPMRDAFRVAGRGWGATYHARRPIVRIDFVLVSPEWQVISARVPPVRLSDHRPLHVNLRWRE